MSPGDAKIWCALSLEAIKTDPACFVTSSEEERAIPFSWFTKEIGRRHVMTAGDDEALAVLKIDGVSAHISSMFVRPSARRKGLADDLLSTLQDIALQEGCTRIALQVFEDNTHATSLYQKHGFDVRATQPLDGRIDCLMVLDLGQD